MVTLSTGPNERPVDGIDATALPCLAAVGAGDRDIGPDRKCRIGLIPVVGIHRALDFDFTGGGTDVRGNPPLPRAVISHVAAKELLVTACAVV